MSMLTLLAQIVLALGIANVWLVRVNRPTPFRAGGAASMVDEYFFSADSELLIVPQEGRLRLCTELGVIDLAPQEIAITPRGLVLPCHAAETITALEFETVHDRPLAEIWANGAAFTAYRGTGWMPELCGTCDRKEKDWGGCRCQAFAWNGDAATTDPACSKAPNHAEMRAAAEAEAAEATDEFEYRMM